ncbi:hypothetical protein HYX13_02085 [Candidatus Woesearchaeota archaeon]|nr:hypothetical protein [Candidatus Woesearchaeota archaeon]
MINKAYLDGESLLKIQNTFKTEGSALLFNFFDEETLLEIKKTLSSLPFKEEKEVLKHNYAKCSPKLILKNIPLKNIFQSKEFLGFLSFVLNKKISSLSFSAYSFTWKDYTLLHDEVQEKPGVDIILDLAAVHHENWNEAWGGVITYLDGSGEFRKLPVRKNVLALVERKTPEEQRFVQYVNHYAEGKKRYFLLGKVK